MYKEIMIERVDGAETPTGLMANAATPYRYKQIFGEDLLTKFANAQAEIEGRAVYQIGFIPELAYVMALQAEKDPARIDKATQADFFKWIEQFESFAFESKADEIIEVYVRNMSGTSEAKKNSAKPKGK